MNQNMLLYTIVCFERVIDSFNFIKLISIYIYIYISVYVYLIKYRNIYILVHYEL